MLTTLSWWLVTLATMATPVVGEGGFALTTWAPLLDERRDYLMRRASSHFGNYMADISDEGKEVIVVGRKYKSGEFFAYLIVYQENVDCLRFAYWVQDNQKSGLFAVNLRPTGGTSSGGVSYTYADEYTADADEHTGEMLEVSEAANDRVQMVGDFLIWVRTLPEAEIERRRVARRLAREKVVREKAARGEVTRGEAVTLATVATPVVGGGGFALTNWAPLLYPRSENPIPHRHFHKYLADIRDKIHKEVIVVDGKKSKFGTPLAYLILYKENTKFVWPFFGWWVKNDGKPGLYASYLIPTGNTSGGAPYTYIDEFTEKVWDVSEAATDQVEMFGDFMIWVRTLPIAEIERRQAARIRVQKAQNDRPHRDTALGRAREILRKAERQKMHSNHKVYPKQRRFVGPKVHKGVVNRKTVRTAAEDAAIAAAKDTIRIEEARMQAAYYKRVHEKAALIEIARRAAREKAALEKPVPGGAFNSADVAMPVVSEGGFALTKWALSLDEWKRGRMIRAEPHLDKYMADIRDDGKDVIVVRKHSRGLFVDLIVYNEDTDDDCLHFGDWVQDDKRRGLFAVRLKPTGDTSSEGVRYTYADEYSGEVLEYREAANDQVQMFDNFLIWVRMLPEAEIEPRRIVRRVAHEMAVLREFARRGSALTRWAPLLYAVRENPIPLGHFDKYLADIRDKKHKEVIVVDGEKSKFGTPLAYLILYKENTKFVWPSFGWWVKNDGKPGLYALYLIPTGKSSGAPYTYIDEYTEEVREVTEGEDDRVEMFDAFMIWVRTLPEDEIERREAARIRVADRLATIQKAHKGAVLKTASAIGLTKQNPEERCSKRRRSLSPNSIRGAKMANSEQRSRDAHDVECGAAHSTAQTATYNIARHATRSTAQQTAQSAADVLGSGAAKSSSMSCASSSCTTEIGRAKKRKTKRQS